MPGSNRPPVVFVQMPFAAVERPSIGLSLISAALTAHGIENQVAYPNLDFAEHVGLPRYRLVDMTRNDDLVGEWVFARAAFREENPDPSDFWDCVDLAPASKRLGNRQAIVDAFAAMREAASEWIDQTARRLLGPAPPQIVGASSMFQQHTASLALLRRVKELAPQVVTVLGGANCDGEMGRASFAAFPWVDCVVCGEADDIIVEVMAALLSDSPAPAPAGVLRRNQLPGSGPERELPRHLDSIPTPDFDDYFLALQASPIHSMVTPGLLIEASRGCWWGQKHHCTFCGLNASGMSFRAKSSQRTLDELGELSQRHGMHRFELTDNILAMERFRDLLPALADGPYTLFAEVKANLRREHLQGLARAGVRWIQPGLENLNDDVLRLMDKGTTAAVNLQLLKWAREFGIFVSWNFLVGFPGEQDLWYTEMAQWLPNLTHLQPPQGVFKMRYDRYSPYQTDSARFGIKLQPHPAYRAIYPAREEVLADLAYFHLSADQQWDPRLNDPVTMGPGLAALSEQADRWSRAFWTALPAILSMEDDGQQLRLLDTRSVAMQRRRTLTGLDREIYLACDAARTLKSCAEAVQAPPEQVQAGLEGLCRDRLMLGLPEGRYLALAVAGELPRLLRPEEFPGGACKVAPGVG
jgi:magnesium-protoporphyrin IX monomethyl ester (oxidative) cyclase